MLKKHGMKFKNVRECLLPKSVSVRERVALNKQIEHFYLKTPFQVLAHFEATQTAFGTSGPPLSLVNNYKLILGATLRSPDFLKVVQIIDNQLSAIEANLQLQDNIALAYNNGLLAIFIALAGILGDFLYDASGLRKVADDISP